MDERDHSKDFFPHTSERSPDQGRPLETYELMLGFKRKELEGQTVLDLGSAEKDYFSSQLKAAGVKAKIVSINPDLSIPNSSASMTHWENNVRFGIDNEHYVAAVGQALPFLDEAFDKIFALESVSKYAQESQFLGATALWTSEAYRVLKKGGSATFIHSPLYENYENYLKGCEYQVDLLKKAGFEVGTEQFSHEGLEYPLVRIKAKKT